MDPIIILAILAVLVLSGLSAVGTSFPAPNGALECIRLDPGRQLTSTTASAAQWVAPFGGRIMGVRGGVQAIGGTVDPTDVDLDPEIGTADILSAPIPAVDSSTIAAGGLAGTLEDTEAELTFSAGDVLHLDVTITGGTSPTVDGVWCDIYYVRT